MPNNGTTIFSGGKLPSSTTKHRFSSPASTTSACPSFRIYYYDSSAGSIPFEWESHPGTPKHPSSDLPPPPPLTPPPSHFSFSGQKTHRRGKKPSKIKILALIPTKLFWLSNDHNNKVKKLSASSPSLSERVLIDDNEYDLFKFDQTKGKVNTRRFSSFDSSIVHYPPIRRSRSCFGIRSCFIW